MQNAIALAHVMGPVYLLFGLSILLYVKSWHRLFEKYANDHDLLFIIEFMYAILGAVVINMYNVWEWNVWLLVTLTGWALAVKSAFYFLMPGSLVKKLLHLKQKTGILYLGGLLGLVFGATLTYFSYFV